MRPALAMMPFMLVAGTAAAHGPFDGRWAFDAEVCATERGTSDLVPVEIHAPDIRYYESACTIEDIVPIGDGTSSAWQVEMGCAGEGETWNTRAIFAIDHGTDERRSQLIEIDMETGSVVVHQSCDWSSGAD